MPQKEVTPKPKPKTADEIIAEAKAAYKAAGGGQIHEYSNAPYKMAAPKKEAPAPAPVKPADTGIKQEAKDAGSGIAYKIEANEGAIGAEVMPQKNIDINKAVADAKETLARVNKNFPPLPKEEKPKEHEYSNTPYKMARIPKPKSDLDNEIEGTGKSINNRLKQQKAVRALPELN